MTTHRYVSRLHDRVAPPGPSTVATFICSCCKIARLAAGRRKIGRQWACKACWEVSNA